MRYLPWGELAGRPHIVVDGPPSPAASVVLSHWHGSGTPHELLDDLSTQIVFRYLERPDLHVDAELASNNHFDEDGLCGIYALVDPHAAVARRNLICDVAAAGDFGTFASRDAARIAMAIGAYGDAERSPMGASLFSHPYEQQTAALYEELLGRLPEMLAAPERFKHLWEEEDARMSEDEARLASREITITEQPDIDLAIVRAPATPNEMVINNATPRHRILTITDTSVELRYRYETWVRYISRPTMPRVDLTALAEQLSADEPGEAMWRFDGVDAIYPRLRATASSGLPPEDVVSRIEQHLRAAG